MAEEFPLPSSSYKELIKIIRAYGRIAVEATLADVAKLAVMNENTVSSNNKFLIALGIIKSGQKKAITPLGAELAKALDHEMPEEMSAKWRAVVEATDFLQNVIAAVRIRKSMDESSLESHVAYSAGQPKTPAVATGARTVVDILTAAGLLKEEDGNLIPATPEPVQCTPADLDDLGHKLRKVLQDFNQPPEAEKKPEAPPAPPAADNEAAEG